MLGLNIPKHNYITEPSNSLYHSFVNILMTPLCPTCSQTMPSAISGGAHGQVHIPSNEECGIRDVWKHNLEEEFRTIRKVVQKYHFVAMDTEFPGVVARPVGEFRSTADYHYQLLRCNVDLLRIIQLGLTFMDDDGKTPPGYSTWQFNFKFNLRWVAD